MQAKPRLAIESSKPAEKLFAIGTAVQALHPLVGSAILISPFCQNSPPILIMCRTKYRFRKQTISV